MKGPRRPTLLLLALLLVLNACGPLTFVNRSGTALPGGKERSSTSGGRAAEARQAIRQQLAAGNPGTALSLVRRETQASLPETALAEEYGDAVNGLLKQADQYLEKILPEKAGPLYRSALEGYPETPAVAAKVDLTATRIAARISACADQLMDRGLVAYRQGDLNRAIAAWKQIQAFDPQHQASLKALQTAEVQRTNLEKVNPGN